MPISAAQMPAVQDDLVQLCGSGIISPMLAAHLMDGGTVSLPNPEWTESAVDPRRAFARYERRLTTLSGAATLYHASAEMTAVANAARSTMPGYRLHPEDLPAERGLVVFDAPIAEWDATRDDLDTDRLSERDRRVVEEYRRTRIEPAPAVVIGALWGPALTPDNEAGVLVVTWSENAELVAWRQRAGASSAELAALRQVGTLAYHDETVLPFGDRFHPDARQHAPIANAALGTLITTWLLMGQPITSADPEPLPRQVRRARERAGQRVPDVRVVRLRHAKRASKTTAEEPSGRQYRHQWFVEGHWRNQWYPSRNDHRPIYIPTHLKGPDGAPILDPKKVYDWRR